MKFLKAFRMFGLSLDEEKAAGVNYSDRCPFSGKEDKFFVNVTNGLWDTKTGGRSGNLYTFVREFFALMQSETTEEQYRDLADDRKLVPWCFREDVAYNSLNGKYLIAYRNRDGEIINIGHYRVGGKSGVYKTSTLPLALLGLEKLYESKQLHTVWICEGEWDYFAAKWLLKRGNWDKDIIPIALPGANVFKSDWSQHFKHRKVVACLDNDEAGYEGVKRLKKFLLPVTEEFRSIEWPEDCAKGYDLRDFILEYSGNIRALRTTHKSAFLSLTNLFKLKTVGEQKAVNRSTKVSDSQNNTSTNVNVYHELRSIPMAEAPHPEDIEAEVSNHLLIKSFEEIDVLIGTVLANKIPGPPVWLFFVGPPGVRKTELIRMLNGSNRIETVSTLTPAGLISGMKMEPDPSLIPQLNNRVLAIKDLTPILNGPPNMRDEIFSILRDAYDGYVERHSGLVGKKSFRSNFGVIAGVTNVIDGYQSVSAQMGERFIKLRLDIPVDLEEELDILDRAMSNISKEAENRHSLEKLIGEAIDQEVSLEKLPEFASTKHRLMLQHLAILVARLRSSTIKDKYTNEQLTLSFNEVASRISQVLTKLAMGIAIYRKHFTIGDHELKIIRRIALDTAPDRVEAVIRLIYQKGKAQNITVANATNLDASTVSRFMAGLCAQGIVVKKVTDSLESYFHLSQDIERLVRVSGIYADSDLVKHALAKPLRKRLNFSLKGPKKPKYGT